MQCVLNNRAVDLSADDHKTLLAALRANEADLSVRFGCGSEHCGACTVMVDSRAENACTYPLSATHGRDIVTAQGLSEHPIGRHVLSAFIEEQAAQCGYCINGIMLRLTALFTARPSADEELLRETLSRHLCRCGAHSRILKAAKRAQNSVLKEAAT
jgi:nicotinate dehydrogenase subunit A